MIWIVNCLVVLCIFGDTLIIQANDQEADVKNTIVWGPGLSPEFTQNLPASYVFIQAVDGDGSNITTSLGQSFKVSLEKIDGSRVGAMTESLDCNDGSYIGRYKLFKNSYIDMDLSIKYRDQHVAYSPYRLKAPLLNEVCKCPMKRLSKWLKLMQCSNDFSQIKKDLKPFKSIDMKTMMQLMRKMYHRPLQHSFVHYVVKDNQIYRQTYGRYVDFKSFSDSILLSLARKFELPDMEFIWNLGDWPLINKRDVAIPVISWCGSDQTFDLVLPTYDITKSTLDNMGRVSLDMLSVQGHRGPSWNEKFDQAFFRGRDSRQERLDLVKLSRSYPDLINASLTYMFFFDHDPEQYGELVKPISFFDFFKFKYQINIDGTVAAYRFPYLLAGDSLVLKQESSYYEHFYNTLEPFVHFVPFKKDLSDLLVKIEWVKNHEDEVKKIIKNAQKFVTENLLPKEILCYHAVFFQKYAQLLKDPPEILPEMELVPQPKDKIAECECKKKVFNKAKEEL